MCICCSRVLLSPDTFFLVWIEGRGGGCFFFVGGFGSWSTSYSKVPLISLWYHASHRNIALVLRAISLQYHPKKPFVVLKVGWFSTVTSALHFHMARYIRSFDLNYKTGNSLSRVKCLANNPWLSDIIPTFPMQNIRPICIMYTDI